MADCCLSAGVDGGFRLSEIKKEASLASKPRKQGLKIARRIMKERRNFPALHISHGYVG